MSKELADLFTLEIDLPRRPGRPITGNAKSPAQRMRDHRQRIKLALTAAPQTVAVLFAKTRSVYHTLPGTDVFDIKRDARSFSQSCPVVAHPPCRAWGRLKHMAKPRDDERELAIFAIQSIHQNGGVLEHPQDSSLWQYANLPPPGFTDELGGYTFPVNQSWFGHRAPKPTWLYIKGCPINKLPPMPFSHSDESGRIELMGKSERESTPLLLAQWLLTVARACNTNIVTRYENEVAA